MTKLICIKDLYKNNEHFFVKGNTYSYEIREDKESMFPYVVEGEIEKKYWFNEIPISNDYIWLYFITIEDQRNNLIEALTT